MISTGGLVGMTMGGSSIGGIGIVGILTGILMGGNLNGSLITPPLDEVLLVMSIEFRVMIESGGIEVELSVLV
jgi:hypothetical protein